MANLRSLKSDDFTKGQFKGVLILAIVRSLKSSNCKKN